LQNISIDKHYNKNYSICNSIQTFHWSTDCLASLSFSYCTENSGSLNIQQRQTRIEPVSLLLLNATKHSVPPLPFFMEAIKIRLLAEQSRGEYINEIKWRIKYVRQAFKYTFSSALIIKEFSVLSRALIKFCSVLYCSVVWQKVAFWKSLVGSWRIWYHLFFSGKDSKQNISFDSKWIFGNFQRFSASFPNAQNPPLIIFGLRITLWNFWQIFTSIQIQFHVCVCVCVVWV